MGILALLSRQALWRLHSCGFQRAEDAPGVSPPRREKQNQPIQLSFNSSLKVDFQGSRVTSDGGLILVRKWDERLRFS
jgi:hypothetical protein